MNLSQWQRAEAPPEVSAAAAQFERQFSVAFDTLTLFPKGELDRLHQATTKALPGVLVASENDSRILAVMERLSTTANTSEPSDVERAAYLEGVYAILRALPGRPERGALDEDTIYVGPGREGRLIATALGWLPDGRSIGTDAKRIPFHGGLLVGLGQIPAMPPHRRCVILDGAIASGATIMAFMEQLRTDCSVFDIFSVHCPQEGLRALVRYSEANGLQTTITVGHATTGLNYKFYATDPGDASRMVLGDVGDTIAPVFFGGGRR